MFLQPDKLPSTLKQIKMRRSGKDSLVMIFSGSNFQPAIIKNRKDTVDSGFTIESVVFKSKSGNKLNGWFLTPKNIKAPITLLHLHGNSGSIVNQFGAVAPLIKNGFQIFVFDYSGFGFSEGKATRKNVLIDALSAVDYLKERNEVKGTKFVLYGQSLGGNLSAVVAAQRQDIIDGLVIEGGFSSHGDIAAHFVKKAILFGFIGRIAVKPGYNSKKAIKKNKKPLLVIHSTEDKIVPFFMGTKIYEKANSPKEFYEIQKCHICGPYFYTDSISKKIIRMVR